MLQTLNFLERKILPAVCAEKFIVTFALAPITLSETSTKFDLDLQTLHTHC